MIKKEDINELMADLRKDFDAGSCDLNKCMSALQEVQLKLRDLSAFERLLVLTLARDSESFFFISQSLSAAGAELVRREHKRAIDKSVS